MKLVNQSLKCMVKFVIFVFFFQTRSKGLSIHLSYAIIFQNNNVQTYNYTYINTNNYTCTYNVHTDIYTYLHTYITTYNLDCTYTSCRHTLQKLNY